MGKTEIIAAPGTQTIDITREFAAPRDLVFRAYTEPDLLVKWLGGRRHRMEIDTYDVRDGGRWRYIHSADDGDYAFHGVFHGTPSLERGITQTFEFEGWPGQVSLETVSFEDRAGTSVVRIHAVYQSVEARDAMIESGMEDGMNDGFAALDELLAAMVAPR